MHAAQLRKKLGVTEPSREERYSKRIRNADDSAGPSPGEPHSETCYDTHPSPMVVCPLKILIIHKAGWRKTTRHIPRFANSAQAVHVLLFDLTLDDFMQASVGSPTRIMQKPFRKQIRWSSLSRNQSSMLSRSSITR